jgi:membrane-associated phospholipid phosphatase
VATDAALIPLKDKVARSHPGGALVLVSGGSFPSRWWLISTVVTAAVMWSGTCVHDSWLSDTVAGALGGAGSALPLWRAFAPLLRSEARAGVP